MKLIDAKKQINHLNKEVLFGFETNLVCNRESLKLVVFFCKEEETNKSLNLNNYS